MSRTLSGAEAADPFAKDREPIPRHLRISSIAAQLRRARLARYRQVAVRLLGGQILPYREDNAIAVLSYGDDQGARATIYLRAGEHRDVALRSARLDDTVIFYWFDRHCGYAVAAAADPERLSRIAQAIFDHFEAPHSGARPVL